MWLEPFVCLPGWSLKQTLEKINSTYSVSWDSYASLYRVFEEVIKHFSDLFTLAFRHFSNVTPARLWTPSSITNQRPTANKAPYDQSPSQSFYMWHAKALYRDSPEYWTNVQFLKVYHEKHTSRHCSTLETNTHSQHRLTSNKWLKTERSTKLTPAAMDFGSKIQINMARQLVDNRMIPDGLQNPTK